MTAAQKAVLMRLLDANSRVFCALTDYVHGDVHAKPGMVKALGEHYQLVLELLGVGEIDIFELKQAARDAKEELAAKPELIAPHVVKIDDAACEHQYLSEDSARCLACKVVFVDCADCGVHSVPMCLAAPVR